MGHLTYKILGVGHPRTGTGYTHALLRSWGLDVGHEKMKADGMIAWPMAIPKEYTDPNRLPWIGSIDHLNLDFETYIYNLRNPKSSIPSIVFAETGSFNQRAAWIPMTKDNSPVENAILSIHYFDKHITSNFPTAIIYRVEEDQDLLFSKLSQKYNISKEIELPSNKTNSRRYDKSKIDWDSVRPKFREIINDYCNRYEYDLIY